MDTNNNTDAPSSSNPVISNFNTTESNNNIAQPVVEHEHKVFGSNISQPPNDQASNSITDENIIIPKPVVRVLSPRGVEYVFLIISLFTAASALIGAIISLIFGFSSFDVLAYPTASLVVSVPVFALLFLRLKKAETNDPDARLDPSKRRSTQFTQIVSFIICFFVLIGIVFGIFYKMAGKFIGPFGKIALSAVVIEVIIGGILFYYWRDEHR